MFNGTKTHLIPPQKLNFLCNLLFIYALNVKLFMGKVTRLTLLWDEENTNWNSGIFYRCLLFLSRKSLSNQCRSMRNDEFAYL